MSEKEFLNRIITNPGIFAGKPIIKGRRIAVEHILYMLSEGATHREILDGYPFLAEEDIAACELWEKQNQKGDKT